MNTEIYKVVIRDGKYMGEMEAILLLKRKWWKFTWWERKNFARGKQGLIQVMCNRWFENYFIDILEDRTTNEL